MMSATDVVGTATPPSIFRKCLELLGSLFHTIQDTHLRGFERVRYDSTDEYLSRLSELRTQVEPLLAELLASIRCLIRMVPESLLADAERDVISCEGGMQVFVKPQVPTPKFMGFAEEDGRKRPYYSWNRQHFEAERNLSTLAIEVADRINRLDRWTSYLPVAVPNENKEKNCDHPRVCCDLETHSVWLDGKIIGEDIDPTPFRLFSAIADARGKIITSAYLRQLPGLRGSAKIKVQLDKLPPPIRRLVASKPAGGGGYWLQLPPLKNRP